jgi:hypothetical protein
MDDVLAPWIEAMGRHDIHICLLSATFTGMEGILPSAPDAATVDKMMAYQAKHTGRINAVAFDGYMTEAEVRDAGRKMLMHKKVDLIYLLDVADELYTAQNIDRIFAFIERNPLVCWYRTALRNYIHDDHTYLVEPFTPARAWWCRYGERVLTRVNYDNDCVYAKPDGSAEVEDKTLPNLTIPAAYVSVRHHSWLDDERSRRKIAYQTARWQTVGAGCSYAWDDVNKRVTFNQSYFDKLNLPPPEVRRDE